MAVVDMPYAPDCVQRTSFPWNLPHIVVLLLLTTSTSEHMVQQGGNVNPFMGHGIVNQMFDDQLSAAGTIAACIHAVVSS